jgi:hypothetical protein
MSTSGTVGSFVYERSNRGGGGKKLKGDGQSIGQEEKREGAHPALARADVSVLLTFIN